MELWGCGGDGLTVVVQHQYHDVVAEQHLGVKEVDGEQVEVARVGGQAWNVVAHLQTRDEQVVQVNDV